MSTGNEPPSGEWEGGLYHIQVPDPPHPQSVPCPKCCVQHGRPCIDLRKPSYPFNERHKGYAKRPHKERITWAKRFRVLQLLRKHGSMRASELGAYIWPDHWVNSPSYMARPAMNILSHMERDGQVERVSKRWGTYWRVKA